jgi:stearoyl-CoA desaturase (delta-9 desaturase)
VWRWLIVTFGNWLTGVDPKGWAVLHRMHHAHSDTEQDPHSPLHGRGGGPSIIARQLFAYNRVLDGLLKNQEPYTTIARDLDFPVSWVIRMKMNLLPYIIHGAIAGALGWYIGWLLAAAYFFGVLSHGYQGWLVNWWGHAWGTRNFPLDDNSRNNHAIAWLILGEGLQNNHHRYPSSARFSYRFPEFDPGYVVCRVLDAVGILRINRRTLMPAPAEAAIESAPAS